MGKKNYELEIVISGGTDASLAASINRARREINGLEMQAGLSVHNMEAGIDGLGKMSDKFFGGVVKGAKLAAAGTVAILGASTAVGMGFESQMSTVQAISQASAEDMKKLTALAKEMGETTQFSAQEAGQGLEYMAMAGWKTQDMINGLPGIMYLAAASGEELGAVSDIVTDAMTAFGMSASESARFADVLAQASSSSNTNVAMMGETFQYVAPVAGAFGYTIEDVAVATGLMANAGIKGQKAGTAMRTMLTNLAKPTKQMKGYMDELSISLVDGEGNTKPFNRQMEELRKGFSSLSEAEKAEYAAGIAGKEGMSGLLAMVTASDADFAKLTQAIGNSTGAAQRMSEVRLDNLAGDLTLLKSAAQGTGIEIYGGFSEDLRDLTQDATGWLTSFTGELREDIPTIRRQMKEFGAGAKEGFEPVLDFGAWCLKHPNAIKGTLTGITTAFGAFKAVQAAKNGISLLGKLSGMMSAWPVAAFGLATGAIAGIAVAIDGAEKSAAKANLADHFGKISLSMADLDETARHIVSGGGSLFNLLDSFNDTSGIVDGLEKSLASGLQEIQKSNWKLSLGVEFDESETESYIGSVESYIQNAQDYITNSGYEVKLAIGLVFGEDSSAGKNAAADSDAFYQSLYEQLKPLQSGLQVALKHIAEDGLTLPKQEIVDSYLSDISEITSMIAEAQNSAELQMLKNQYAGANMLSGDTFQKLQQSIQEYTDTATEGIDNSYKQILTSLNAQRLAGERGMEGGITQGEFDAKSNDALAAYYEQKAQTIQNGYQVMKDAILSTYGKEIEPALDAMNQQIQTGLPALMESSTTPESFTAGFDKLITDSIEASTMSSDAKNAVKLLMEGMIPTQEDLEQLKQQMIASGVSPATAITDALDDMAEITAVTGDEDSIWKLIGDSVANNEDYALLVSTVSQQTGQIPDVVIQEISAKNGEIEQEARNILDTIRNTFAGGIQAEIPITLDTVVRYKNGSGSNTGGGGKIAHNAKGGLIQNPTLSWFAEDSPEMAIPLDGSARSLQLWQETGELLGAYEAYNANNYDRMAESLTAGTVTENNSSSFAPVLNQHIYFTGGTGEEREKLSDGLSEGYERFEEWMDRWWNERRRVAF